MITNSQDLAQRMARLTHMMRDGVQEALENDHASTDVRDLYKATRETLVADLSIETFADMFAQTLAYGLFASRVSHSAGGFDRRTAVHNIHANPFLSKTFNLIAGSNAENELFIGFVDDIAQLLANSDIQAILADFGKRGALQDPIMYFYETFLTAYDPNLRERRGVYYTPEPVISYIVRSIDLLLRERFDCAEGLADNSSLILDPACGTGSFLHAVVDNIRQHYIQKNDIRTWNDYVQQYLFKRIVGFELMMAPYSIAHLKLSTQLTAFDVFNKHRSERTCRERVSVYLANALEQLEQYKPNLFNNENLLVEEAEAASKLDYDMPIMVVLGNPPYSGHSSNASRKDGELTWIGKLIEDYKIVDGKSLGERNLKWLQDDYVKFIRFGHYRIQQNGAGILAFITNHAYLDNLTFKGMRQQLIDTFTDIYLLDLHGNAMRKERDPYGNIDQNVFDIRQGVAIALFVKEPNKTAPARVHHADIYGEREAKYETLSASDIATTNWERLDPTAPNYLFKPWNNELASEYGQWQKITDIMPISSSGVITARDKLTIHWTPNEVLDTMRHFASLPTEIARNKYELGDDTRDWKVNLAQNDINNFEINLDRVQSILYRPFDIRHTYYTGVSSGIICKPRQNTMKHMLLNSNLGLVFMRQVELDRGYCHFGVSDTIVNSRHFYSNKGVSHLAPLYIYPPKQDSIQWLLPGNDREPNLSRAFTADLERRLGLRFIPDGRGDLSENFGPEDVFHYIYAVFHAPAYRERYDQFLRADFPRVPLTDDTDLFRVLVGIGAELTAIHLLKSPNLNTEQFAFPVPGDNIVEKAHPKYYADRHRVYINEGEKGQYFDGVSPDIWASNIGGYQPMLKWLKDRRGRTLTFNDIEHYQSIAASLQQTNYLTAKLDNYVQIDFNGLSNKYRL